MTREVVHMRNFLTTVFLLAGALLFSTQLQAQDTASITGVIADATGALIPNVSVNLTNPATGATYVGTSNGEGSYTIANVRPGPGYKLTLMASGFKTKVVTDIYLNVDATRTQNVRLDVGGSTASVVVSASAEQVTLDTTDATVGNNFEVQFLNDLPVENRDSPAALFYQQPGVTLAGAVTGARVDQTNVTLDGLEVNDNATGEFGAIVGNAPVDSVQEFRGVTAGALSSAGQGSGAQFELVTRSGTNQFHGAAVEYHRDTDLEANNWFNDNDGVPRSPLIRNQFGGNFGGPIKKDRLFFFFDYNGRRDTLSNLVDQTVPLDSYRAGNVSYYNDQGGISTLSPAQVQALDPAGIGFNSAFLTLMNKRYPHANDLSGDVGDLVNTAGFRFNAPFPYAEDDYVQRVDYNMNSTMKLFGKGSFTRTTGTQGAIQFPGDPPTYLFKDQSYAWVVGHSWTIGTNKLNQFNVGETFENYRFDKTYNPQGDDAFSFSGLTAPYQSGSNSQDRTYPIPIIRDDFSWEKGNHSFAFGGTFKWETPNEFADENFNFPDVGVTGNTYLTGLTPNLRPADIDNDVINGNSTTIYDSLFSTALGVIPLVSSNFNYNNKGVALPTASGLDLNYRYYETEIYGGDTWKLTPHFTLSYGLRYQAYTVPYETHGTEAVSNVNFNSYFGARLAQSAAGLQGNNAVPLISYTYGGKANNAPGYFQPQDTLFAPRVAFAYVPGFDSKTVFSAGAGIVNDHTVVNALQFQQLESSYLFEALGIENLFGTPGDQTASLGTGPGSAPRFSGIASPPPGPSAPTIVTPFEPFVSDGVPYGLQYGEFNIIIDPKLKTPYSFQYNFGVQHEFPQGYILKATYVGREGRRLLAEADASQLIEFPDNTGGSSQVMSQAMAGMTTQLRQNIGMGALGAIYSLSPQPWFEDMLPGFAATVNANNAANGNPTNLANSTQAIAYEAYPYPQRGDFADTIQNLSFNGLAPNVGMPAQFAGDTIWTNKGFSSYNGLLITLHKNAGYGLQFDLNYTYSHSIDNVSLPANSISISLGYGYICDVVRPRECRGNSDFGVTNYLNGNFIYELPFGRGKDFGATAPFWLNEIIGGWLLSGLPYYHTGNVYNAGSNAYVAGFANNAPATLTGPIELMKAKVNGGNGNALYAYTNPTGALAAYTGPTGFAIGTRNNLRGPGYFDFDMGLGKTFPIYQDRVNLKFRCDAFNVFNHPNFNNPVADITEASGIPFGTITSTVTNGPSGTENARVLQGALRLEF
jgi:hypothetical protein